MAAVARMSGAPAVWLTRCRSPDPPSPNAPSYSKPAPVVPHARSVLEAPACPVFRAWDAVIGVPGPSSEARAAHGRGTAARRLPSASCHVCFRQPACRIAAVYSLNSVDQLSC